MPRRVAIGALVVGGATLEVLVDTVVGKCIETCHRGCELVRGHLDFLRQIFQGPPLQQVAVG